MVCSHECHIQTIAVPSHHARHLLRLLLTCVLVVSAVWFIRSTIVPELLNSWTATLVFNCTQACLLEPGWRGCRM